MTQGLQTPIHRKEGGKVQVVDAASGGFVAGGRVVQHVRVNATAAEVNAGKTLLAALGVGYAYRLVDAAIIAIGGAATTATTVDILATLSSASRKLVANAVAGLTQSTMLRAGAANAAILADGASFTVNDGNTPITVGKTGSNVAGATSFDIDIWFVVDEV